MTGAIPASDLNAASRTERARQVGLAGDEAQRKQVTELLDETRRKVYAILAEDRQED